MKSRMATAHYPGTPMTNLLSGLLVLALLAGGCTTRQSAQEAEPAMESIPVQSEPEPRLHTLTDTDWKALSILGKPAGSADSTLGFSADGRVAGNAGCNGYQGEVTLDGNTIEFGLLATTRMMCPPPVNGQEIVFLEALGLARSWDRSGNILELIDDTSAVVVRLTQQ